MEELLQATVDSTEAIMELSEYDNTITGALAALEELHQLHDTLENEMGDSVKDVFRKDFELIGLDIDNYSKESFLSVVGSGLKAAWKFIWAILKAVWERLVKTYKWFKGWFVKEDSPTGKGGGELVAKMDKVKEEAVTAKQEDPTDKLEKAFASKKTSGKIMHYKDAVEMRSDMLQIQEICNRFTTRLRTIKDLLVYFSNDKWFDNEFKPVKKIMSKYGFRVELMNGTASKPKLPKRKSGDYLKLGWTIQNTLDLRGSSKDVNSISKSTMLFYKEIEQLVEAINNAKKDLDVNKLPVGINVNIIAKSITMLGWLQQSYKTNIIYVMQDIRTVITDAIGNVDEYEKGQTKAK